MTQGSEEWLQWRMQGIGSSDIAAVVNECPYRNIMDVYYDKIGEGKPIVSNPAMQLGSKFESSARGHIFFDLQLDVDPGEFVHPDYSFIRASLDGVSQEKKLLFEIKYMGLKNFEKVTLEQKPLPHHLIQMQWQFLASDLQMGYYVPYTLNENKSQIDQISYIPVSPNKDVMQDLHRAANDFWMCVLDRKPPIDVKLQNAKTKRARKKST